jgi:hypothetical protein
MGWFLLILSSTNVRPILRLFKIVHKACCIAASLNGMLFVVQTIVDHRKLYITLIIAHGLYILVTALWPLLDIKSFMEVTGPKNDIWLVKTVGVLLIPIVICLFSALFLETHPVPVILVGISCSAGLAVIDFYYTSNKTIRGIYAWDGVLEIIFLTGWVYLLIKLKGKLIT